MAFSFEDRLWDIDNPLTQHIVRARFRIDSWTPDRSLQLRTLNQELAQEIVKFRDYIHESGTPEDPTLEYLEALKAITRKFVRLIVTPFVGLTRLNRSSFSAPGRRPSSLRNRLWRSGR
jgi:hypothetical protein